MNLNTEIRIPPILKWRGNILLILFGIWIAWKLMNEFGWIVLAHIFQAIDRASAFSAEEIRFYVLLVLVWVILAKLIWLQSELSVIRSDLFSLRPVNYKDTNNKMK